MCDIPPELDGFRFEYSEWRKRSINTLKDYEALTFCNFIKRELRRILNCFGLLREIRVECHANNDYIFSGEAILIYGLIKLTTGMENDILCHLFFGGASRHWSSAYKWFLFYLYGRYYPNVLGVEGLVREVVNFPYYAKTICRRFNHERYYLENHTYERIDME